MTAERDARIAALEAELKQLKRERHRERLRAVHMSPAFKETMRRVMAQRLAEPVLAAKLSAARSANMKARWADPESRAKLLAHLHTPEIQAERAARLRDPAVQAPMQEASRQTTAQRLRERDGPKITRQTMTLAEMAQALGDAPRWP